MIRLANDIFTNRRYETQTHTKPEKKIDDIVYVG